MLIVTLAVSLFGAPQIAPADRLANLLDAIHGIDAASSNATVQEAIAICGDPTTYLPLLDGWLDPKVFGSSQDPSMAHRVTNAFALAVKYCGADGQNLAEGRLKDIRAERDAAQSAMWSLAQQAIQDPSLVPSARATRRKVDALIMGERMGLIVFGSQNDPRLVPELLPRIKWDDALALEMVEYFIRAAPGDPQIQSELKALRSTTRWITLQNRIDHYMKL